MSVLKSTRDQDISVYKIITVGQSGVGKSNMISRYIYDKFSLQANTTIGVQFVSKILIQNQQKINIQIWDTAGQERYRSVNKVFYKNAIGALVVFSLGDRESFEKIPTWLKQIKEEIDENAVYKVILRYFQILLLVGNKCDLKEHQVSVEEATKLAKNENMAYIETSAMLNINIAKAYQMLVSAISVAVSETHRKSGSKRASRSILLSSEVTYDKKTKKKNSCCN